METRRKTVAIRSKSRSSKPLVSSSPVRRFFGYVIPSPKHIWLKNSSSDYVHTYGHIITSTFQSQRPVLLRICRYKSANLSARNYYELLGVERTATTKEIKKAFFTLSKEYHPDANASDKSLHEKFVKINEAFSVLSKQSTRNNYDQSLHSIYRSSYPSPDGSNMNYGNRGTPQSHWHASYSDKAFQDMLRRRAEFDRQRSSGHTFYQSHQYNYFHKNYFGSLSIVLIIIGFGIFIHALQWRMMHFSDPQYAINPRTRHYYAYREWQRISGLKDADSIPLRQESSSSSLEED